MKLNLINIFSFLKNKRTKNTYSNILYVFFFKILSVLINFISIPITLKYLNPSDYGIWLTINSILVWFSIFDIGLSNGLRNKLTEKLAKNKLDICKIYISTTYFILFIISILCMIIIIVSNYYIDWNIILNTKNNEINKTILFVGLFFFIRFFLQTINIILQSHNKYSIPGFWELGANIIFLLYVIILNKYFKPSLLYVGVGYSILFTIILFIQNIYYFRNTFKNISPSVKKIKIHLTKDLLKLSSNFLIIQLGGLFLFSSNNLLISHYISTEQVTVYNIVLKYYSIITVGWTIILTPYLTSFNDAYNRNDYEWVKKQIKVLNYLWIGILFFLIIMTLFSGFVYDNWIGKSVFISDTISIYMAVYTLVIARINIYGYFLNSIGTLRISTLYGIFTAIINIPILYLSIKFYNINLDGIIILNTLILIPNVFLTQYQYNKIFSNSTKGIWFK